MSEQDQNPSSCVIDDLKDLHQFLMQRARSFAVGYANDKWLGRAEIASDAINEMIRLKAENRSRDEMIERLQKQQDAERQAALDLAIDFWGNIPGEGESRPTDAQLAEWWSQRMADKLAGVPDDESVR